MLYEESANELLKVWNEVQDGSKIKPWKIKRCLESSDPISVIELFDQIQALQIATGNVDERRVVNLRKSVFDTGRELRRKLSDPQYYEKYDNNKAIPFSAHVHKHIITFLSDIILHHFINNNLPRTGVALYFTNKVSSCYIIDYSVEFTAPEVDVVGYINNPAGLLNIENVVTLSNPMARNIAKSFYTSGHKVVIQADALTHLDRRLNEGVFGPSIDTLVLADLSTRISREIGPKSFLDIGCGSGHIASAVVATAAGTLDSCSFVDINPTAVSCTHRNIIANLKKKNADYSVSTVGIIGKYDVNLLSRKHDLIVCNPPYVALPPHKISETSRKYTAAVAGVELINELLSGLDELVLDKGCAVIMTSSTSLGDIELAQLGDSWEVQRAYNAEGLEVPFDVEAILSDEAWLDYLLENGGLSRKGSGFVHRLKPLVIRRRRHEER